MSDINHSEMDNSAIETEDKENRGIDPEKGKLILAVPIRSRSEDVNELDYDFGAISTKEYIAAMDSDREARNPFRISYKQAINLFAAAVACATEGIDATDIRERLSVKDAVYASQLASLFFAQQTQAAAIRSVKG